MVPVEFSPAMWCSAIYCWGVRKPPGIRRRIMKDHKRSSFFAAVAVVLLVHAVELHQRLIVFPDGAGELVEQGFGQGAAEAIAALLDPFGVGQVLVLDHMFRFSRHLLHNGLFPSARRDRLPPVPNFYFLPDG